MKYTDSEDRRTPPNGGESIKSRLLSVIGSADSGQVAALLDGLWASGRFVVQRAPRCGLIMCTVRDPFDTPFHLGEVLVSQAEVRCDGQPGCGVVCGDAPEQALLLAAVEAAELRGCAEMLASVGDAVRRLEQTKADHAARLSRLAAATRVRFDSMKKERVDFDSLGESSE